MQPVAEQAVRVPVVPQAQAVVRQSPLAQVLPQAVVPPLVPASEVPELR